MIIKIKKLMVLALFALTPVAISGTPALAAVNCNSNNLSTQQAIKCGSSDSAGVPTGSQSPSTNLNNTVAAVINIASIVVGAIAVIMLIIGGLRYTASSGNTEGTGAAKKTITYALIGLVIVALAQIVVHFVLDNLNSATGKTTSNSSGQNTGSAAPAATTGKKPAP